MLGRSRWLIALLASATLAPALHAGLYYSGERFAELPSQWRGFLLDHRLLRTIAIAPTNKAAPSAIRRQYQDAADKLEKLSASRPLTADEAADLGALHVRLGDIDRAVAILRSAQRQFPRHFHIAANLGTAWQLQGNLDQAAAMLELAVRLASPERRPVESYHLRLVRARQHQRADALDDLFGVRYVSDDGSYHPAQLAAAERQKLPAQALAITQDLALALPADGRLLWQLAELANAQGDIPIAAAIMDGCVNEFGMHAGPLREHRRILRDATIAQAGSARRLLPRAAHETHATGMRPRSKRPLLARLDEHALPAILAKGVNPLPWAVIAQTAVDRTFHPTFARYLEELEGREVSIQGYMQPLGDDPEAHALLLIENPVGCWYCEMPDITNIIRVDLPADQTFTATRNAVKITGTLTLNRSDPENFLYTISSAHVVEIDPSNQGLLPRRGEPAWLAARSGFEEVIACR